MNIGLWKHPAVIAPNHFKFKSLSCWSFNPAVGCKTGCRFCYVPNVSTIKLGPKLKPLGVNDPDAEWGDYVFVRAWDEKAFLNSLRKAEATKPEDLPKDGNRAVMFSTTTDAYQVLPGVEGKALTEMVGRALELIRDNSSLNVRILTRWPLARIHFDLFKSFGPRLAFGMSLPTLDNKLARVYEPNAPSPAKRLETLQGARAAGLNVFVAMAPTYPECTKADLRATLNAIADLQPITVFHEPINIRADNVARFEKAAALAGVTLRPETFDTKLHWADYSIRQMFEVEAMAFDCGLLNRFHLWPDPDLEGYATKQWLERYWKRVSEWPK